MLSLRVASWRCPTWCSCSCSRGCTYALVSREWPEMKVTRSGMGSVLSRHRGGRTSSCTPPPPSTGAAPSDIFMAATGPTAGASNWRETAPTSPPWMCCVSASSRGGSRTPRVHSCSGSVPSRPVGRSTSSPVEMGMTGSHMAACGATSCRTTGSWLGARQPTARGHSVPLRRRSPEWRWRVYPPWRRCCTAATTRSHATAAGVASSTV
mmetsp:Transcript_15248/g.46046  ORF Transcript_15248/g.46046 Transcript_15248/m.46046 type:complete len:209 (-) Transcript_15248:8670-9296(-)